MKKTLGMVFFLTVLAGMAGCGQKNTVNTMEQTDTQPETVQKRLNVYHEQTQPLIDYYTKQGILKTVDGTKNLDEVFGEVVAILGE